MIVPQIQNYFGILQLIKGNGAQTHEGEEPEIRVQYLGFAVG